ncbi:hypothetical protein C6P87_10225 [Burkholderia sp. AU12872]|nr:hypothetical protein EGY28_04595 [Burkholderia dolosa]PRE51759.1 hypothetical protein C6P87_10225 [Burkholderia sp. AU12872]
MASRCRRAIRRRRNAGRHRARRAAPRRPGPPHRAEPRIRAQFSPCRNFPDSRYSHIPRNTIPPDFNPR